jgi:hypothetical protein
LCGPVAAWLLYTMQGACQGAKCPYSLPKGCKQSSHPKVQWLQGLKRAVSACNH